MNLSPTIALFSVIGGLLPAIFWLHFWLHEDNAHPEPRGRIIYTFIMGMIGVILVIPIEQLVSNYFIDGSLISFFLWASSEELIKFGIAYFTALRTRYFDEPIDAVIYMITAAVGFSALENTFFILQPLIQGDNLGTIISGNIRFIGASLLHVAASSIVGVSLAFAFYKSKITKWISGIIGLIIAIILHTAFNFFIIESESQYILLVLGSIWISAILLIVIIERIKFIRSH
ncbi:MAG: PrsW family glutamic-type intramembrane protease [bacterium]